MSKGYARRRKRGGRDEERAVVTRQKQQQQIDARRLVNPAVPLMPAQVQAAQATIGNQAVQRLLLQRQAAVQEQQQMQIDQEHERAYELFEKLHADEKLLSEMIDQVIEHICDNLPPELQQILLTAAQGRSVGTADVLDTKIVAPAVAERVTPEFFDEIMNEEIFDETHYEDFVERMEAAQDARRGDAGKHAGFAQVDVFLEAAVEASERLKDDHPELFNKLKEDKLEMLWFIVEPQVKTLKRLIEEELGLPLPAEFLNPPR